MHLQVLNRLLSKIASSHGTPQKGHDPYRQFLGYIIATCYPKIAHRLKHKTLSEPYIQALNQVGTFDVQIPEPSTNSQEISGNRLFLEWFLLCPTLLDYPKLSKKAERKDDKDSQLYTKDTCAEFHKLLLLLLERFKKSLALLHQLQERKRDPIKGSMAFNSQVTEVMIYGCGLQALAQSAALQMHLQSITPFLMMKLHSQAKTPMPAPDEEEIDAEIDADLNAVQPFVTIDGSTEGRVWKSYIDWMKLIVVHFDTVEILFGFFNSPTCPFNAISVCVLSTQVMGKQSLWLQDIISDKDLKFPTETIWTPRPSQSGPPPADMTNIEILKHFDGLFKSEKGFQLKFNALIKGWDAMDYKSITNSLDALKPFKFPGWEEPITRLLDKLTQLGYMPEKSNTSYLGLLPDYMALSQSYRFYAALQSPSEAAFRGSLHCEACLASLLVGNANVSDTLAKDMEVCYFSSSFLSLESHFL